MSRGWGAAGVMRLGLVALIWSLGLPAAASSQSLTMGEVAGTVADPGGIPLDDALVTVVELPGGASRTVPCGRDGRYHLTFVRAGAYQLVVEHLGYRPVRVLGVFVRSGSLTEADVTLAPAAPPVTRVDTLRLAGRTAAGLGEWFAASLIRHLPDSTGDVSDLARLSSGSDADLGTAGLPGFLSGVFADGVPYRHARNPGLPGGQFDVALLPPSTLDAAALIPNGVDAEWAGFGGGTLLALSRAGSSSLQARLAVDATGNALSGSTYFNTGAVPNSSLRGTLLLSGPISRDSGQWVIGVDGRRLETPSPAPFVATPVVDSILTVAQDSFKVNLGPYVQTPVTTANALTAFTGFTWQTSAAGNLTINARYATATTTNPDLGLGAAPSLGATLNTRDFLATGSFASGGASTLAQEFHLGLELSHRSYGAAPPPVTTFADLGAPVGSDAALPGSFERTTVRVSETLYHESGIHRLKFGAAVSLNSHDLTYGYGASGIFSFAGPAALAVDRGAFERTTWASPEESFSAPQFGVFGQDVLSLAPGLDFLVGLRYDGERLPQSNVVANQAWLKATGINNAGFNVSLAKFSPRLGLTWDVAQRHATEVRAAVGVYFDEIDPGLLWEAITTSLGDTVRRGVGSLPGWPAPAAGQPPVVGSQLTVLAPKIQAPRTGRADFGVRQALGGGFSLGLSGSYDHTDYLPERRDLNLLSAPSAHDQYGRPIYGTLVQQGNLLVVQPGTNRRFPGFDVVSAIAPTAYSDHWAFTTTLERQVGSGLHLLASYTYSHTTDDWLAGQGGGPGAQLSPFPDSLSGRDWADRRSDFDIPHRVVLSAEARTPLPLAPIIAVVYRYRSGAPFTPGYPAGVDPSGAGSATSPAFVDATLPGMSGVFAQWDCLRTQAGQFAVRNSCRDPSVQALDVRVTFNLARVGGAPFQLVLDGLNLLESDVGLRDHALVTVNPAKAITANPALGTLNVPLVANPNFGNVLVHRATDRALRIGLRVNF